MRLILEKHEIVAILGKHFDADLDPDKVIIRTDPFEIEVCGLPLAEESESKPRENNVVELPKVDRFSPASTTRAVARADPDASTESPPPGNDGAETSDDSVHPSSVLETSKALEQELNKQNPQLARRSGRWSDIAPINHEDEI